MAEEWKGMGWCVKGANGIGWAVEQVLFSEEREACVGSMELILSDEAVVECKEGKADEKEAGE
jgi:hypothetical protein